jgi:hypothetical protein
MKSIFLSVDEFLKEESPSTELLAKRVRWQLKHAYHCLLIKSIYSILLDDTKISVYLLYNNVRISLVFEESFPEMPPTCYYYEPCLLYSSSNALIHQSLLRYSHYIKKDLYAFFWSCSTKYKTLFYFWRTWNKYSDLKALDDLFQILFVS